MENTNVTTFNTVEELCFGLLRMFEDGDVREGTYVDLSRSDEEDAD